jgi:hypothetical protein
LDVSWLQVGEFRQDIIFCIAPGKILKKGDNRITQSTDARLAVAYLWINGDPGEQFTFRHIVNKADLFPLARPRAHCGRKGAHAEGAEDAEFLTKGNEHRSARALERSEPEAKPEIGRQSDQLIPEAKPEIGCESDQLIPEAKP